MLFQTIIYICAQFLQIRSDVLARLRKKYKSKLSHLIFVTLSERLIYIKIAERNDVYVKF